tara:strand:- start:1259 stop:2005 length:747 start_codon:yes stop_codon:yes gene_type:complete
MRIVGITRVRNEQEIIKNTLDHVATLVDEIYVYDDCSTDDTPNICESHPAVVKVIRGTTWASSSHGRADAEGSLRQQIYLESLKSNPDWVYYFDSDEIADFDGIDLNDTNTSAYSLRLFDYYITKDDVTKNYREREWMGPEYRDIMMLFRPSPKILFKDRQPLGFTNHKLGGFVKHYGKAVSIVEWEKTCDYYIEHRGGIQRPFFTNKWKARKGKAIHTESDFGRELIKWEDRKDPSKVLNLLKQANK